jgi:hypothetical protein
MDKFKLKLQVVVSFTKFYLKLKLTTSGKWQVLKIIRF